MNAEFTQLRFFLAPLLSRNHRRYIQNGLRSCISIKGVWVSALHRGSSMNYGLRCFTKKKIPRICLAHEKKNKKIYINIKEVRLKEQV